MARTKGRVINIYAPAKKGKRSNKVSNRIFPKVLTWIMAIIILIGLIAKLLHVIKHHW